MIIVFQSNWARGLMQYLMSMWIPTQRLPISHGFTSCVEKSGTDSSSIRLAT